MKFHAIVPVKTLYQAKSRLAEVLTPAARHALVLEMLERVLRTLRDPAIGFEVIWLVSADPVVLEAGAGWGASVLHEIGGELNLALEQARTAAFAAGAEAVLVVPGDVPLMTPEDVVAMTTLLSAGADVAIAPDAANEGTNALGLRRQASIPFSFGLASAMRHQAEAAARGLHVTIYQSPTLALDIDRPAHLVRYRALTLERAAS